MEYLKQIKKNNLVKKILILGVLFLLIFPVILPFFNNGYFLSHDGEWAVVRLVDMFRSIKDLQFPVRYSGSLNFGFGYPLFNFAYPLPYYLGLFFVFLQFGFVGSIKALFVISILLSALGMYLLSKTVFKSEVAGVATAVFYTYLPYHLVDIFVRGSIGESLAFGMFPFILLFVFLIFSSNSSKKKLLFSIVAGVFLGLLVLTHNIMAVLFIPVLITFVAVLFITRKTSILSILLIFIVGFGISAFFFIPALVEKGNILLSVSPIADRSLYFVAPIDLIWSPFGYGTPTATDPFTYQIGVPILIALFLAVFVLIRKIKKKAYKQTEIVVGSLILLVVVFIGMLFSQTEIVWENLPLLSEINYPWTLLSQIGFVSCVIAGYIFVQGKLLRFIGFSLVVMMIVLYVMYAKPAEYINRGDMFYITNLATTTSSNELMPLWVRTQPSSQVEEKVVILEGTGSIANLVNASNSMSFDASLSTPSDIQIRTIYYPGWKAFVNGKNVAISYNNEQGIMNLSLSAGQQKVELEFTETPVRLFSNILSLVTALGVVGYMVYFQVTRRKKHEK